MIIIQKAGKILGRSSEVKMGIALANDFSLVPGTHMEQLTTLYYLLSSTPIPAPGDMTPSSGFQRN